MDGNVAMQARCPHCGHEQFAHRVWDFSHGRSACFWCSEPGKIMTTEQYRAALRALYQRE